SFQLSPIRLLTSVSAVINGGHSVVPHFGVAVEDTVQESVVKLKYEQQKGVVSDNTSENMKMILESVVTEGSGHKASVEGYSVGAKTGTSEKLPRRSGKYIASCLGFAPADNPKVLVAVLIDEPQGIYYGGTIAAPVVSELLDNALPYLGVEKSSKKKQEP
ncbi:MAG: peptidoglycan glycosyltransferase, partial [Lachnospiraceae bacterium]|nr:peptidoglycan glycosyltransferase [Lachnospiraceae bacterium]